MLCVAIILHFSVGVGPDSEFATCRRRRLLAAFSRHVGVLNPSRTVQQATLKIDEAGIRVTVEEGRSLQGEHFAFAQSERATRTANS